MSKKPKNKLTPVGKHHRNLCKDPQIKMMAIMRACLWSRPTFYNKLKNPSAISPVHQKAIARIYKQDLKILFPGEIFEHEPKNSI